LGVAAVVVAVDQATKWWAVHHLEGRIIHLVWTFRLNLTYNYKSSFSLLPGGAVVSLIGIVLVALLVRAGTTAASRSGVLCLGLVLGGAVGNLIDRAIRPGHGFLGGGVVDWIDPQWWPIFNIADSAIVVGGIMLVLIGFRESS
jgi:signal peptidase II